MINTKPIRYPDEDSLRTNELRLCPCCGGYGMKLWRYDNTACGTRLKWYSVVCGGGLQDRLSKQFGCGIETQEFPVEEAANMCWNRRTLNPIDGISYKLSEFDRALDRMKDYLRSVDDAAYSFFYEPGLAIRKCDITPREIPYTRYTY